MFETIIKRDGRRVPYDITKIQTAIGKAMASAGRKDELECARLARLVEERLLDKYEGTNNSPTIEDIQDMVEKVLMENGYAYIAKKYILYRAERTKSREMNTALMRIYNELTFTDAGDSDMKRDNANIDGNAPDWQGLSKKDFSTNTRARTTARRSRISRIWSKRS